MVLGRVGLTGATGMLGRHVRAAFAADGVDVALVSRSGRDGSSKWDLGNWLSFTELDELFGEVTAVIHAGAIIDSVPSGEGEARFFDINVRACASLAEWALSRSIPLVFISSASVYADADLGSLSEGAPLGVNPLGGYYGMTKLLAEDILCRYRANGLKLAILRPSSLYGYGGSPRKMLYKFLISAMRGETIDLAKPVDDQVDFLHAADLSSAIVRVLKSSKWGTFNVASENPVSIHELANACVEVAGGGRVRVLVDRPQVRMPVRRFFLDASAARQGLCWAPKIGIRQGLSMVLAGQLIAAHSATSNQKVQI